jgi:hypothetical protein
MIHSKRKCAAVQPDQTDEHAEEIPELAQRLKAPVGERGHIRGEPNAQQVHRIENSLFVPKTKDIARPRCAREKTPHGVLFTAVREVAQEGVAGAKREESQDRAFIVAGSRLGFWKQSVDDLERRAVSTYGKEFSVSGPIGLANKPGSFSGSSRFCSLDENSRSL